jgi:hypothetical protein
MAYQSVDPEPFAPHGLRGLEIQHWEVTVRAVVQHQ